LIRARVERHTLNPASPSPPRAPIAVGRSVARRTIPARFVIPEIRRRTARATPQPSGGTDEEDDVHGIDAYCDDAPAGGRVGHDERTAERLMTAFEVAEFVGCHEETVRRADLRGLLTSKRFGVRGKRFHPRDVLNWIARGAPTRVS
jgi:hypothetical protein